MPSLVKFGIGGRRGKHSVCHMFWFYPCLLFVSVCLHCVLAILLDQLRCTIAHRTCFLPRKCLSLTTKMRIYHALVQSVLLYAAETWGHILETS